MTTPTKPNGARVETQSRALIRVELTYDNGERAWLEGEDAQRWANAANACIGMAFAHGTRMPELPWQTATSQKGGE